MQLSNHDILLRLREIKGELDALIDQATPPPLRVLSIPEIMAQRVDPKARATVSVIGRGGY